MPPILPSEYEALADFRYALRQFLHFSEQAAQSVGLTPQQHQALLAIKGVRGGRLTVGELADRLQTRQHSAVGLVNRLVLQGLLLREPSAVDRRRVYLRLSPQGEQVLERLSAVHRDELKRLGPELRAVLDLLNAGADPAGEGKITLIDPERFIVFTGASHVQDRNQACRT